MSALLTENRSPAPLACSSLGWSALLASHHGVKNRGRGYPNQDAGQVFAVHRRRWLVGSVADGHGGHGHPRSARGSLYAVYSACSEWTHLLYQRPELKPISAELYQAAASHPDYTAHRWRDAILAYHDQKPWQPEEFAKLSDNQRNELNDDPVVGYGATLLSVALSSRAVLASQLGDGAMVAVDAAGRAELLFGGEDLTPSYATDSLCHSNAAHRFHFRYLPLGNQDPVMLLLATDGYVNAFPSAGAFLEQVSDLWRCWRRRGRRYLAKHLQAWVRSAADATSHDDATVALFFRNPTMKGRFR